MLTPLNSPPTSISPEEHAQLTSSTPASFVDIPPVLRWSDDVQVALSPRDGGWEGWGAERATGKLYVTEDAVAFLPHPSTPQKQGFSLPFPSLTLHALTPASPDGQYPAHLYCQVDEGDAPHAAASSLGGVNGSSGDAAEGEEDEYAEDREEDYTALREVRIYLPENQLQSLFEALSACSALHASLLPNGEPSSFFGFGDDGDDYDDGEDGQWEDADETGEGEGEGGRVRIIRFDSPAPAPRPTSRSRTLPGREHRQASRNSANTRDISNNNDQGIGLGEEHQGQGGDDVEPVVNQMERFLNLVDWGDVAKPKGWDE